MPARDKLQDLQFEVWRMKYHRLDKHLSANLFRVWQHPTAATFGFTLGIIRNPSLLLPAGTPFIFTDAIAKALSASDGVLIYCP
jgi:hypothetical protein